MRLLLTLVWFAAAASAALAAGTPDDAAPCRVEYVGPYAEQCDFAYRSLKANSSPADLSQAFDTCARSQDADVPCVKSSDRNVHAAALSAMYRSVSLQAEIALYTRQFRVAEALLHERLKLIDIVQGELRPGDNSASGERATAQRELAESQAGECTQRALASAGRQYALAKAHKYDELAGLLHKKYDDSSECARAVRDAGDRAYVEYVALVALEQSGRAMQAAGHKDAADRTYQDCVAGAERTAQAASSRVKSYLNTVGTLCRGRKNGTYAVDSPRPLDAQDGKTFSPLTLPGK
jgi:hypothetical protein